MASDFRFRTNGGPFVSHGLLKKIRCSRYQVTHEASSQMERAAFRVIRISMSLLIPCVASHVLSLTLEHPSLKIPA
jgi:hypothetical protein